MSQARIASVALSLLFLGACGSRNGSDEGAANSQMNDAAGVEAPGAPGPDGNEVTAPAVAAQPGGTAPADPPPADETGIPPPDEAASQPGQAPRDERPPATEDEYIQNR